MEKTCSVAVCDDEKIAVDVITSAVTSIFGNRATVEKFYDTASLSERMKSKIFDLLLLDIEMPYGKNSWGGVAFAKEIRRNHVAVDIIFVSNRTDRVFDTFECNPFAFVRKSNLMPDIKRALQRYIAEKERFADRPDTLLLKKRNGIGVYDPEKIMYFEGMQNVQRVYMADSDDYDEIYSSISALCETLSDRGFFCPHRSFVVNFGYVAEIQTGKVIMKNGFEIPIRRGFTKDVRVAFMNYLQSRNILINGS